jgi:hypothetical protein
VDLAGGTSTVTVGSGSVAVSSAGGGVSDLSVGVGSEAIGVSTTTASPVLGLAGAFATDCLNCSGGWTSSDGSSGTFSSGGDGTFAGPPGGWTWQWQGIGEAPTYPGFPLGRSLVGGWAPIGGEWTAFH